MKKDKRSQSFPSRFLCVLCVLCGEKHSSGGRA
jgi:hypothetical protein